MPQWDFLDFLRQEAESLPCFKLRMEAPVIALVERDARVEGVELADGETIAARKLVIMADGRDSIVRRNGLLPLTELGAQIDVLWFSVPKEGRGDRLLATVEGDRMMVLIDRTTYWQCAFVIAKGGAEMLRARGIATFRESLKAIAPQLERLEEALPDWASIKMLNVSLDRLEC